MQFENGYIYWSPRTHAHAVPAAVFAKYSSQGWEAGFLGYPMTDPTDLPEGTVQGFEGGAIYRKDGAEAYILKGAIREYWNRSGFENGKFGWPVGDETTSGRDVYQDFEDGRVYWVPKSVIGFVAKGETDTPILSEE